jgi:hypothetical protein
MTVLPGGRIGEVFEAVRSMMKSAQARPRTAGVSPDRAEGRTIETFRTANWQVCTRRKGSPPSRASSPGNWTTTRASDHLSNTPWVVPQTAVLRVAFGGAVAMLVTCGVGQIGETTL